MQVSFSTTLFSVNNFCKPIIPFIFGFLNPFFIVYYGAIIDMGADYSVPMEMRNADEVSIDSSSACVYSTFRILIFSFLRRYANAARETMLSKALPMPKRSAMPMSVGVHTPVA